MHNNTGVVFKNENKKTTLSHGDRAMLCWHTIFSGVSDLQGVEISVFLFICWSSLQQCWRYRAACDNALCRVSRYRPNRNV